MATLVNRLPDKNVAISVFVVCMIPIHLWAILGYFYKVPGFLIRMSMWNVLGIFAYNQAFALLESIIVTLLILGAAVLIPAQLLRGNLAIYSALFMLILSIWMAIFHFSGLPYVRRPLVWGASLVIFLGLAMWSIVKWERLAQPAGQLISRLSVLAAAYLVVDAISILLLIIRNLNF